ncbi:hypothetical protein GN244_ATG12087 [Phytophthora infestans]|uniref:Uncharacterized protein n=1 Tax=Phytophthora infestans TaxID=4787 RepID=A0A833WI24_PHYIN|nr:hypothetical protein GN244_ATG12087 [Phytophthora infestans]
MTAAAVTRVRAHQCQSSRTNFLRDSLLLEKKELVRMLRSVLHAAREHRHRSRPTSSRMDVVHFGHSSEGASKWTDMAQATVDEALDVKPITPSNVVFFSPRAASKSTGRGSRWQAPMAAEVAEGLVGMVELGSGLPGFGKFES